MLSSLYLRQSKNRRVRNPSIIVNPSYSQLSHLNKVIGFVNGKGFVIIVCVQSYQKDAFVGTVVFTSL